MSKQVEKNSKFLWPSQKSWTLKFGFSKKPPKFGVIFHLFWHLLSKSADLSKQLEDNCEILWSSQKSWTLKSCFEPDFRLINMKTRVFFRRFCFLKPQQFWMMYCKSIISSLLFPFFASRYFLLLSFCHNKTDFCWK